MNAIGLPWGSTIAPEVDLLFIALMLTSGAVLVLVFGLMFIFATRYRHDSPLDRGKLPEKTWRFETAWTVATMFVFFLIFIWGADLYLRMYQPPRDALKISVIGKQWMWKIEHPGGQREINTLHVPVNRDVELLMTSEDVIHDFGVPAFRVKRDVLPGRYETLWFRSPRIGVYHMFCNQLCGTDHSEMVGRIVVMSGPDYQRWLEQNGTAETLAAQGRELFIRFGCSGCHQAEGRHDNGTVRAPSLDGVYGSPVPLSDGSVVVADERYIRDSILQPRKQVVASYDPVMPSFAGVISEEDIIRLIAYIKSLAPAGAQG